MQDSEKIDRIVRRWLAEMDAAGEREGLEEAWGDEWPEGVPLDGHCLDADGKVARTLPLRLVRTPLPGSGGMKITIHAPPIAGGAFIGELRLEGMGRDGERTRVSLAMGDVREGKAEVELSEGEVERAPIDLKTSVPVEVEMRLQPWLEQVIETVQGVITAVGRIAVSGRPIAGTQPAGAPEASEEQDEQRGVPWMQAAETSEGELQAHVEQVSAGELRLELEASDPDAAGEILRFAAIPGEDEAPIWEAYAQLRQTEYTAGPAAAFLVPEADMPESCAFTYVFLENVQWTPDDRPLLQWTAAHAAASPLRNWAQEQIGNLQEGDTATGRDINSR